MGISAFSTSIGKTIQLGCRLAGWGNCKLARTFPFPHSVTIGRRLASGGTTHGAAPLWSQLTNPSPTKCNPVTRGQGGEVRVPVYAMLVFGIPLNFWNVWGPVLVEREGFHWQAMQQE